MVFKAAMLEGWNNETVLHENRSYFPEEKKCIIFALQHGGNDVTWNYSIVRTFFLKIDSSTLPSVDKCYQVAKKAGKKIFAVQFYGECWVGNDDSEEAYMKYGSSTKCWSGVGQRRTNYVYKVKWWMVGWRLTAVTSAVSSFLSPTCMRI